MTRSRTTKETKIKPINTIHRKTFLPSLFGLIAIPKIINNQQNQFLIFQQKRITYNITEKFIPTWFEFRERSKSKGCRGRSNLGRKSGGLCLINRLKILVIQLSTLMSREGAWKVFKIEWDVSKVLHLSAGFVGILVIGKLTNFQTRVHPNRVITVKKIA